ncbi:MAG: hypothetical protein GX758_00085 [Tenericutes bacterium]|nr:hypothetical protein [Mycoplasmatota bacterium]
MKKQKIIIIVFVVVLIFCIFLVINKLTRKDENKIDSNYNDPSIKYDESLSLTSDLTISLYYSTRSKLHSDDMYFYKKDKILISEVDKDIHMNILFYKLERMNLLEEEYILESIVKEEYSNIFGKNNLYSKLDSFFYDNYEIKYGKTADENEYMYYYKIKENKSTNTLYVSEIVSSFKYNDKIEITEIVAFVNDNGSYIDSDYKNKISDKVFSKEDILNESNKLNKYKYTFNYNEKENKYYYYSYEKE